MKKYNIRVPDRELASVPANTKEAKNYLSQMASAANFGFCNRQLITHWLRETFENSFKRKIDDMDMHLIYGVCHNILKIEDHEVDGILAKFKKPEIAIEIKWKKNIDDKDIVHAMENLNRINAKRKILFVPDKNKLRSGNIEILDVGDLINLLIKS